MTGSRTHGMVGRLPRPATESWDWQLHAVCRHTGDIAFFPPDRETVRQREEREARAKEFCEVCPVRRDCLQHAQDTAEPYGVWGGLNAHERRNLRRWVVPR